jgi:hypothetical protein
MMNRFTVSHGEEKKQTPIYGYWACKLVPLEQALEPVAYEIPELKRSIKEAKKHCYYSSKQCLTRDESAAVLLYTMEAEQQSFYRILNRTLLDEDRRKVIPWFPFIKLFDCALEKLPTFKGCIWRGVTGDFTESYHEDDIITWWNFSSCSSSVNVVENFLKSDGKSTLFMIEVYNGKDVSGYTQYPQEKEILLPMGTKLRVKSKGMNHRELNVIHLVELNTDDDTELSVNMGTVVVTPKLSKETLSSNSSVYVYLIDMLSYASIQNHTMLKVLT